MRKTYDIQEVDNTVWIRLVHKTPSFNSRRMLLSELAKFDEAVYEVWLEHLQILKVDLRGEYPHPWCSMGPNGGILHQWNAAGVEFETPEAMQAYVDKLRELGYEKW